MGKTIINKHIDDSSKLKRTLFHNDLLKAKGEIIINNDPESPSIYIVDNNNKVVKVSGGDNSSATTEYDDTKIWKQVNENTNAIVHLQENIYDDTELRSLISDNTNSIKELQEEIQESIYDDSELRNLISGNTNSIKELQENIYDDSEVRELINTNKNDIEELKESIQENIYDDSEVRNLISGNTNSIKELQENIYDDSEVRELINNNYIDITINKNNISDINNKIGNIEDGKTITSTLESIQNIVDSNTIIINSNKNIIDDYTINNQKISDSPILNSDDLLISYNYIPSDNIEDVLPNDNITNAIAKVENALAKIILPISASLNQLESEVYGFKLKNITWYELMQLCNNSQLTPGGKYRITDYVTTTSKINTESAGHQFDLIVEALSENVLSENAKACLHDGDDYFTNYRVNIGAWEIKYSLYNDNNFRFDWADTINGKGVIYYMKDEWGNEAPYDFKNIKKDGKFKFDDNNQDASLYFKKMEL